MTSFTSLQGMEVNGGKTAMSPAVFLGETTQIAWNYDVITNETVTVGGKVIQPIGVYMSSATVNGSFGIHGLVTGSASDTSFTPSSPPMQYQDPRITQEQFLQQYERWLMAQRGSLNISGGLAYHNGPPLTFRCYSDTPGLERDWNLSVYLMGFVEASYSVGATNANFNPKWMLTLLVHNDNGTLQAEKDATLLAYVNHSSQTFGWLPNQYNGPVGTFYPKVVKK